jgi:hypothetical protein
MITRMNATSSPIPPKTTSRRDRAEDSRLIPSAE